MAYATESARRAFVETLRDGFAAAERTAVYAAPLADSLAAARDAANAAFAALPLPTELADSAEVREALAAAHAAHLGVLDAIASRNPRAEPRDDEHTRRTTRAYRRFSRAAARAQRAVVAPPTAQGERDAARNTELLLLPQTTDGGAQRPDIAAAVQNGDFATVDALVAAEVRIMAALRTRRDAPEVTAKPLLLYDQRKQQSRRGGRDAVLRVLRRGMPRGFMAAPTAARPVPLPPLHTGARRRQPSGSLVAAEQSLFRAVAAPVTQTAHRFMRLLNSLVEQENHLLQLIEARGAVLRARYNELDAVVDPQNEAQVDVVFRHLREDVAQYADAAGLAYWAETPDEAWPVGLDDAETRLDKFDDLRRSGGPRRLTGVALSSAIVDEYRDLLAADQRANTRQVQIARKIDPPPDEPSFMGRLLAALSRLGGERVLFTPVVSLAEKREEFERTLEAANRAEAAGGQTAPANGLVYDARNQTLVHKTENTTRVFVESDVDAELPYTYDVRKDVRSPSGVRIVPYVHSETSLSQAPVLGALKNWRTGIRGPLTPVQLELFFTRTDVTSEDERLAHFAALVSYAKSVGVLDRVLETGGLGSELRTDEDVDDAARDTRETLLDRWRAEARRRRALDQKRDALDPDSLARELGELDVDERAHELIELAQELPRALPERGSPLRENLLKSLDAFLTVARTANLDARYRFGNVLSYMYRPDDESGLGIAPDVAEAVIDARATERAREAIQTGLVAPLQVAQVAAINTAALPADQAFRAFIAAAETTQLGEARVVLARSVPGEFLDERFAGRELVLQYTQPTDDRFANLPADQQAVREELARVGVPVSTRTVRVDERLARAGTDRRRLRITDTIAHIDPNTVERFQVVDQDTQSVLTVLVGGALGTGPAALRALGSVAANGSAQPGAIANAIAELEAASQRPFTEEATWLQVMRSAFRESLNADAPGGIAGFWGDALNRGLLDPLDSAFNLLTSLRGISDAPSDVLLAQTLAIANVSWLVTLAGWVRSAGVVLGLGGLASRARRALADAVGWLARTISNLLTSAFVRSVVESVRDTANYAKTSGAAQNVLNSLTTAAAAAADQGLIDKLIAAASPSPAKAAQLKTLWALMLALGSGLYRVGGVVVGAFVSVMTSDDGQLDFCGTIVGVVRLALGGVIAYTLPRTQLCLLTTLSTFAYATLVRYTVRKCLAPLQHYVRNSAGLRGGLLKGLGAASLGVVAFAPWLISAEYNVLGVVGTLAERVFSNMPLTALPDAAVGRLGQQQQLAVVAGRALARIGGLQLLDILLGSAARFSPWAAGTSVVTPARLKDFADKTLIVAWPAVVRRPSVELADDSAMLAERLVTALRERQAVVGAYLQRRGTEPAQATPADVIDALLADGARTGLLAGLATDRDSAIARDLLRLTTPDDALPTPAADARVGVIDVDRLRAFATETIDVSDWPVARRAALGKRVRLERDSSALVQRIVALLRERQSDVAAYAPTEATGADAIDALLAAGDAQAVLDRLLGGLDTEEDGEIEADLLVLVARRARRRQADQ